MRTVYLWTLTAAVFFAAVGCSGGEWKTFGSDENSSDGDTGDTPPQIAGTVAEVCVLVSGGDAPIGGWGVVVGLGKNGSSEVPPSLKSDLVKYLKGQRKIGSPTHGMGSVSVADFLNDLDTAVVRVDAIIPPGAPKGTPIDVVVSAPPGTQTVSLAGGLLWPTELRWQRGGGTPRGRYLKPLGRAEGAIFVNPFLDSSKPAQAAKYRQGRILGGAWVVKDMPIRLQLREPDYHMSCVLQQRINYRFRPRRKDVGHARRSRKEDVAVAKTKYYIDVHIPPGRREDYEHFLQLVMHLPWRSGPGVLEAHAAGIAKAMEKPGANCDSLALVWEAMGRQILPTVQNMYSSKTQAVSYYAARTGLRLGDDRLGGPVVLRAAATSGGAFQLEAVTELGRHPQLPEAGGVLRKLLNDGTDLVRIAAYESLVKRGDRSAVTRHKIDEGFLGRRRPAFLVDVVDSSRDFIIYATHTSEAKIVLFGRNMPLANPIFFNAPDNAVTVFNKKPDPKSDDQAMHKDHVVVYRKLPGLDEISAKFRIDFRVLSLIRTLGSRPRPDLDSGKVPGLGFTYSQVVGVMQQMCKQKNIPAKFVLQHLPELQRIYRTTPSTGRPDVSDE